MTKTFRKCERLNSQKIIDRLFERGSTHVQSSYLFPFKVLYLFEETPIFPPQVLFSISKRNFKKAVDRNLLRRRSREAYRLHKHLFTARPEATQAPSAIAFMFIGKEIVEYVTIEKSMKKLLLRLCQ